MVINIYTKNFALIHSVATEESNIIPRVGETITLEQYPHESQGVSEFLVHEVTYSLEDDKLTPIVSCHGCNGAINRRIILEENGWI